MREKENRGARRAHVYIYEGKKIRGKEGKPIPDGGGSLLSAIISARGVLLTRILRVRERETGSFLLTLCRAGAVTERRMNGA